MAIVSLSASNFQTSFMNLVTISINILEKEATHIYWSVWCDMEVMNGFEIPSGKKVIFQDNQNL